MSTTWKIVDGDLVRDVSNSAYVNVTDSDKCKQDVQMNLSTDIRNSTGIGCGLDSCIGLDAESPASAFSFAPIAFDFQMKVQTGMNRLIAAQRKYQYGRRTAKELIDSIDAVQIWPIRDDPRNFKWRLGILTVDGRESFSVGGSSRG
jgi:hypothetical protein